MAMLPAKAGTCPECAVAHEPELPHNKQSLFYQYHFYNQHGRWPTWADAMAHCDQRTKEFWTAQLTRMGESIDQPINPPKGDKDVRGKGKGKRKAKRAGRAKQL